MAAITAPTATLTPADRAAHIAAQGPVRTTPPPHPARRVLAKFEAGAPRGSWPAEEYAARQRRDGQPAEVVMDLKADAFLVVAP